MASRRPEHRPRGRRRRLVAGLFVSLVLGTEPLPAQVMVPNSPFERSPGSFPTDRRPSLTLARLAFRLDAEIPLPGPLPGGTLRVGEDGWVEIPVAGGLARVRPLRGATADVRPGGAALSGGPGGPAGDEAPRWVTNPAGKRRFRTDPDGWIFAEKRRSLKAKRWRRTWKLRIPAGAKVPPLVAPRRVFVGALDNQVYALKARNGHRLWTADVGQRVTRELALWRGELPPASADPGRGGRRARAPEPVELILVALDAAPTSSLLALDANSGRIVADFEVPESEGRLVGPPAATGDGRVVVARQRYVEEDASLLVFRLARAAPPPSETMPENDARKRPPGPGAAEGAGPASRDRAVDGPQSPAGAADRPARPTTSST